jgi:hypothetical protein
MRAKGFWHRIPPNHEEHGLKRLSQGRTRQEEFVCTPEMSETESKNKGTWNNSSTYYQRTHDLQDDTTKGLCEFKNATTRNGRRHDHVEAEMRSPA